MGMCQVCGVDKDGFIREVKRLQEIERDTLELIDLIDEEGPPMKNWRRISELCDKIRALKFCNQTSRKDK